MFSLVADGLLWVPFEFHEHIISGCCGIGNPYSFSIRILSANVQAQPQPPVQDVAEADDVIIPTGHFSLFPLESSGVISAESGSAYGGKGYIFSALRSPGLHPE